MTSLDDLVNEIERRLGRRRTLPFYIVLAYAAMTALGAAGILVLGRIEELTVGETLGLLGGLLVVVGVAAAFSIVGTAHSVRPLFDWLEGDRDPSRAEEMASLATDVPKLAIGWGARAALVNGPIYIAGLCIVISADVADVAVITFALILFIALVLLASAFMGQIVIRPVVLAVAAELDRPPMPRSWISVRAKLALFVPILLLVATYVGAAISLDPGQSIGDALGHVALAGGMILVFAVPVALLLAYSTLQPLGDLLRATERIKAGDFSTRVPELSGDEHGVLARSFNEAMEGLAERERLAGENVELLDEVRASRARIITASDAERRRVERNIHDGAQQQLVALALELRLIEERVKDDPELQGMVRRAGETLKKATGELRELARGLHPSVLSTDGLGPALGQLATRAPVPVRVTAPDERFSEPVESTAYFVASEALANVAKYAEATKAEVSIARRNGRLHVQITDDGKGGADPGTGSGLAGLADRVAALDGRLTVESPPGAGTTVSAELPLGQVQG
jgi:signal transduction histidine kinase